MGELAITPNQARDLTDRIKVGVEAVWDMVKQAYTSRAWAVLGYDSWDDYCTREFGTSRIRLPREERQEVVASMREIGMSTRAIASVTGDSKDTVRRALATGANEPVAEITGVNGKTYTPHQETVPTAQPEPVSDFIDQEQLNEINRPQLPEPAAPRAEGITKQFSSAIVDLTRVAKRFDRITNDPNFSRNKEKVAVLHRHDLARLIGELQTIANNIN